MEDTLGAIARFGIIIKHSVLILVLMEDTLGARNNYKHKQQNLWS